LKGLPSFVGGVSGFATKPNTYKIQVFGWYMHEVQNIERFSAADLNKYFDECNISRPSNTGVFLKSMLDRKPPLLLKDSKGHRLSSTARTEMAAQFPSRPTAVNTTKILNDLAAQITDPAQTAFLTETLTCFKQHAYRAAIVMAWNLAFNDVLDRLFANHLVDFNAQLYRAFPKEKQIARRSDFEDLKESRIIEVGKGASIFSATTAKILTEKLTKRNTAAHPSLVVVTSVTAEEVISDLVQNVILRKVW
jgi:hypothetical protein